MNWRGVLLLGLVAIGAGVLNRPPAQPTTTQSSPSGASTLGSAKASSEKPGVADTSNGSNPCGQEDGPWTARGLPKESDGASRDNLSENFKSQHGALNDKKVQALIVTVADPVHTRLASFFDEAMDSIVDAASADEYNLDQFWIPWRDKPEPVDSDCASRLKQERERKNREQQPGLLVFRRKSSDQLWVFVVAESPIAGINQTQFNKAVEYIKAATFCQSDCEIRVAGPTFSGSLDSLRELMEDQSQSGVQLKALGLTTAKEPLDDTFDAFQKKNKEIGKPETCMTFQQLFIDRGCESSEGFGQMLQDDESARKLFFDYLEKQTGHGALQKAILSESETLYGASAESKPRSGNKEVVQGPSFDNCQGSPCQYKFPRGISRLREAYAESVAITAPNDSARSLPGQLLPLVLTNRPLNEEDVPPDFAKNQTPLAQEIAMRTLSEELQQDGIQLACITATDPLDLLYLIQQLQHRNPDIQLVVFNWNLLLLRTEDQVPPEGLLSVAAYPPLAREQHWSGHSNQTHRFFPSQYSKALYNAILLLLDPHTTGMVGSTFPSRLNGSTGASATPEFEDYGPTAPLWLSVVGRDAYWPVAILNSDSKHAINSHDGGKGNSPPSLWHLVFRLTDAFSGIYLFLFWWAQRFNHRSLENLRLSDCDKNRTWPQVKAILKADPVTDRKQREFLCARSFYLLMSMLALLLMRWILVSPALAIHVWAGWEHLISIALVAWLLLTIVCLLFVLLWIAIQNRIAVPRAKNPAVPYYAIATVIAVFLAFLFVWKWGGMTGSRSLSASEFHDYCPFFSYRSLQLGSGASPALPLLLLASALWVWAWLELKRLTMAVRLPDLPTAHIDDNFKCLDSSIKETLELPLYRWHFQVGCFALFFFAFYITSPQPNTVAIGEPYLFGAAYVLLLFLTSWLIFDHWFRFLLVWRSLKRILARLEQLPFREAFTRLPKQLSVSALWQEGSSRRTHELLTRSLDALRALRAQNVSLESIASLEVLDGRVSNLVKSDVCGTCPNYADIKVIQHDFCLFAECIAGACRKKAWTYGSSDSLTGQERTSFAITSRQVEPDVARVLAEEFLALRFAAYVRNLCNQMRYLLFWISAGFIFSLLSIESYPFTAHHLMSWLIIIVFILLSAGVIIVMAEMSRECILSRLSKTEPGKLDKGFLLQVVSYGALPLFTVIASEIPGVAHFLFSWVEPALRIAK